MQNGLKAVTYRCLDFYIEIAYNPNEVGAKLCALTELNLEVCKQYDNRMILNK